MRWVVPVTAALLLTGCSQEPDFDARYDKASADISARVKMLDAAVSEAESGGDSGPVTAKDGAAAVLDLPAAQSAAKVSASSGE